MRQGQTLLWEGDGAPVVANVLEGVPKLAVATADGREADCRRSVFPSDSIRPAAPARKARYSVTAMTRYAEVCIFNRNNFDEAE